MSVDFFQTRLDKIEQWQQRQIAYPSRFEKTYSCLQAAQATDHTPNVACAGRLMAFRDIGKLTFGRLQDVSGSIQLAFKSDTVGAENYKFFIKNLDLGDHIGVQGTLFTTNKGEKTLEVTHCQLLSKALRPLPEKWHGLADTELRIRQRYLDLLTNPETRDRFRIRHQTIKGIRHFLDNHDFIEVETPILQAAASGAMARPFATHHHALDIPLYLRIAPETYLKRLIAGGYERVYELGRCFRNEGIDPSHLQEFTMLEFYVAYWNYKDNMRFVQQMLQEVLQKTLGTLVVNYQGITLDFSGDWPEKTYRDLVYEYTHIDLHTVQTLEHLKHEIQARNLSMPLDKYKSLGGLIDGLYKKYCRPNLIQPMFLTMHPQELIPLARSSDHNPAELEMFQVVVNSWEIVKAYSELVDPVLQRQRLIDQQALAAAGEEETMMLEEDFLEAMEHGMPPISGVGVGIERLVSLLSNSPNIRDVIYFPTVRNK